MWQENFGVPAVRCEDTVCEDLIGAGDTRVTALSIEVGASWAITGTVAAWAVCWFEAAIAVTVARATRARAAVIDLIIGGNLQLPVLPGAPNLRHGLEKHQVLKPDFGNYAMAAVFESGCTNDEQRENGHDDEGPFLGQRMNPARPPSSAYQVPVPTNASAEERSG